MNLYQNRIVVKIGTSVLTNAVGQSDLRAIDRLAYVLSDIQNMGYEIILVSSGAIAIGMNKLCLKNNHTNKRLKRAIAAVGQCNIMCLYSKFFAYYDKTIAQILMNEDDIRTIEIQESLINTFNLLLNMKIIPIVNENDSINHSEIELENKMAGDNDVLSAVVAELCRVRKLIILTDTEGFYDSDPRIFTNAKLVARIDEIDEKIHSLTMAAGSRRGTDGMKSKLKAAHLATSQGIDTIITNGKNPSVLYEIIKGKNIGTLFAGNTYTKLSE